MGIQICACMLLEEPGEIKIDPKIKPFIARTYPRIGLIFSHPKYSEVTILRLTRMTCQHLARIIQVYQDLPESPRLSKNNQVLASLIKT